MDYNATITRLWQDRSYGDQLAKYIVINKDVGMLKVMVSIERAVTLVLLSDDVDQQVQDALARLLFDNLDNIITMSDIVDACVFRSAVFRELLVTRLLTNISLFNSISLWVQEELLAGISLKLKQQLFSVMITNLPHHTTFSDMLLTSIKVDCMFDDGVSYNEKVLSYITETKDMKLVSILNPWSIHMMTKFGSVKMRLWSSFIQDNFDDVYTCNRTLVIDDGMKDRCVLANLLSNLLQRGLPFPSDSDSEMSDMNLTSVYFYVTSHLNNVALAQAICDTYQNTRQSCLDHCIAFYESCRFGQLEVATWLYPRVKGKITNNMFNMLFDRACNSRYHKLATWLYMVFNDTDIVIESGKYKLVHKTLRKTYVRLGCAITTNNDDNMVDTTGNTTVNNNNVKVINSDSLQFLRWFYEQEKDRIPGDKLSETFHYACGMVNVNHEIITWMLSVPDVKLSITSDKLAETFVRTCRHGHLELAMKLITMIGEFVPGSLNNKHMFNAFLLSLEHGHNDVAKWLYTNYRCRLLDTVGQCFGYPLLRSCKTHNFDGVKWLYPLESRDIDLYWVKKTSEYADTMSQIDIVNMLCV